MGHRTPFYNWHVAHNGKLVDFADWDMPVSYGSQIEEHHAVRTDAGMFDVSHMTVVDIAGADARSYLRKLLANDVAKLDGQLGKALYTAMLNEQGGVIDDLIIYNRGDWYRAVVNCGTREKDLQWMQSQSEQFKVGIKERPDLAMIALQGPNAIAKHSEVAPDLADAIKDLGAFQGMGRAAANGESFYARTGYTGEDGLEIMMPVEEAIRLWQNLHQAGVRACGLGARDTLRLEAGLNLYGNEMNHLVSPLTANMDWTIAWEPEDRNFIGRNALTKEKQFGVSHKLVGLILKDKGVLRAHQRIVFDGIDDGEITSGSYSPTLNCSIGLARVPVAAKIGSYCHVEMRKKLLGVEIVKPCFVRHGTSV